MAERTGLPKDEVYKKVGTADLTSLNVSEDKANERALANIVNLVTLILPNEK